MAQLIVDITSVSRNLGAGLRVHNSSIFQRVTMRRRAPPTSLRLVQGPTPSRNTPKHTLPSVPRPTFHLPTTALDGPAPRARQTNLAGSHNGLTAVVVSGGGISSDAAPLCLQPSTKRKITRGPWDHSGSISISLDVGHMLAPLKPVAVYNGR